ncbi:redoxin family protein [Cutibacterium sp. SC8-2W]|uniref:redoxin family protein n=1 Tax=Cutibacterium sp. SC8-2W TaxID=2965101 RepID=UPI00210A542E|nr:redoxin family protein [Cutibacterium sp. SC8-2W]
MCAPSTRKPLDSTTPSSYVFLDLPFAQARFCGAEGIKNVVVASAFRSHFGKDLGVTLADGPMQHLLARAIIVVNAEGKVTYTQLVDEITTEPDYDAALEAASKA